MIAKGLWLYEGSSLHRDYPDDRTDYRLSANITAVANKEEYTTLPLAASTRRAMRRCLHPAAAGLRGPA
eukprot:jgi/Tetstr1/443108/TSEL_031164.t1